MNTLPPNPDDLDRLLGRYFKAQMPTTWPQSPLAAVPSAAVPTHRGGHSARARLTLAASVAVLLGLGVAVSYGPATNRTAPAGGEYIKGSTANGTGLQKHLDAATTPKPPTP